MFSSKKPKFSLDLTINELSNIPQVSGYCYIDLQIRDGKQLKTGISSLKHRSHSKKIAQENNSNTVSLRSHSSSDLSDNSHYSTSTSSGNVSVTTSKKKIHNFKCIFNYNLLCNLKFPVKRRENLIGNKYLLMIVYFVNETNDDSNHHHYHATELGKVEVNLSEYLNFNEPVTSKYLLKDSKVNSILKVTILLSQLPSDYDFHTQLQINDSANNSNASTSINNKDKKTQSMQKLPTSSSFNIPQFERKKVLGGIHDVICADNSSTTSHSPQSANSSATSYSSDESERPSKSSHKHKSGHHHHHGSGLRNTVSETMKTINTQSHHRTQQQNMLMDPMVSNLYTKVLESMWEPELHKLFDYSPEKCINDIFEHTGDKESWNKRLMEIFYNFSSDKDDDSSSNEINGLINENKLRDDLKSWSVSNVN